MRQIRRHFDVYIELERPMQRNALPIAAVLFSILGAVLAYGGAVGSMGDHAPWVPQSDVARHRLITAIAFSSGCAMLVASIWLSGYAFARSRFLAVLALIISVTPLAALISLFFAPWS